MLQSRYPLDMPSLPWDFIVLGRPVSVQAQSKSKDRWKTAVQTAARAAWPEGEPPFAHLLRIRVTCFYDGAPPLDADNMLKPIQDALIGIVYKDDRQLTSSQGCLEDINGRYVVRGMSLALANGFVANVPFVHIKVSMPPSDGRLP